MPVSQYVRACLYHPAHGFYMRPDGGRAGGHSGDFLTSPEVGPLFGAVLARALDAWWHELGRPSPYTVLDWGAGPGTLTRSVLAAQPECLGAGALRWVALEVSAAQRALHPPHRQVTSAADVGETSLGASPRPVGVVLANELLDNLGFDIAARTRTGWQELRVGCDAATEGFSLVPHEASPALVEGLPTDLEVGSVVPVMTEARRWLAEALGVLSAGRVVVFDYGASTAELAARSLHQPEHRAARSNAAEPTGRAGGHRPEQAATTSGWGWLRTHRRHSGAGSWLSDPGSCDITTDVDFTALQSVRPAGGVCTQRSFLHRHGIDELVSEGISEWHNRAATGDLRALTHRSRVAESEALLDPAGLGGFTVAEWRV